MRIQAQFESSFAAPLGGKTMDSTSKSNLWNSEYRDLQVIPSSTRATPSKGLLLADSLVDFATLRTALDLGCGIGRNALYLAGLGCEVDAMDNSDVAIDTAKRHTKDNDNRANVQFSLESFFPAIQRQDNSFNLVLDSYVSCHITSNEHFTLYWSEVYRVLRPGGIAYCSVFSPDDEYYRTVALPDPDDFRLITDPNNGIAKRLYTESEILSALPPKFSLRYSMNFSFVDTVLGNKFRRQIPIIILEK